MSEQQTRSTLEEMMNRKIPVSLSVAEIGYVMEAIRFRQHAAEFFMKYGLASATPPESIRGQVDGIVSMNAFIHEGLEDAAVTLKAAVRAAGVR